MQSESASRSGMRQPEFPTNSLLDSAPNPLDLGDNFVAGYLFEVIRFSDFV